MNGFHRLIKKKKKKTYQEMNKIHEQALNLTIGGIVILSIQLVQ